MARTLLAAALLAALLAPAALAATGPQVGPFVGVVEQDASNRHAFSTHGDTPCLAVYLPKLYVVTLTYDNPADTLTLMAAGATAVGSNGVATLDFVANYCTAFTIDVVGTAVAGNALEPGTRYVVTVESLFIGDQPLALA